jgi:hypothetical protein
MARLPNSKYPDDPVQFLVIHKFPLFSLAKYQSTGEWQQSLGKAEDFEALKKKVAAYREEIEALPASEIRERVFAAMAESAERQKEQAQREEAALWFNQPDVAADFDYWAKASYWTQDEAVALSLGKEPRRVTWKALSPHINGSPLAKSFAERRLLVERAVAMQQLYVQTMPPFFLAWARRMKMAVPSKLENAVEALGQQIGDWKTLADDRQQLIDTLLERLDLEKKRVAEMNSQIADLGAKIAEASARVSQAYAEKDQLIAELQASGKPAPNKSAISREKQTLLKLVIGMAIKGYVYDPAAPRNASTREIATDLRLAGLSVDEDTIRKYLTEAKELLP